MQIIAKLRQQGLSQEAAEELLSTRWSESGKANIATGWKQWHGYVQVANQSDTLPVAAAEQIDVLDPTPSQFVEFLRSIRKGFRRDGANQNVSTGANWVRAVRSHVSTTCSLWLTCTGTPVLESQLIGALAR